MSYDREYGHFYWDFCLFQFYLLRMVDEEGTQRLTMEKKGLHPLQAILFLPTNPFTLFQKIPIIMLKLFLWIKQFLNSGNTEN